jgi:acyl-CoA thioester hydrolase
MSSTPLQPVPTQPECYAHWSRDVVRYADTDRQGHVNNAVFSTFFETGRVSFLYPPDRPLAPEGASFVIARLELDYRSEIHWPGEISIGTTVESLGNSSMRLVQGLFAGQQCVATAETVIVLVDNVTRKSRPLPEAARAGLLRFARPKSMTALQ